MTAAGLPSVPLPGRVRVLGLILGAFVLATILAAVVIVPMSLEPAGLQTVATPAAQPQVSRVTTASLRSDKVTIGLGGPGQRLATDYLVRLKAGDAIAYSWTATGEVSFELHSHNLTDANAPGDQLTYFTTGTAAGGNGYLVAPTDGLYGWFFQPRAGAASVVLDLSGFYLPEPGVYAVPDGSR